jgi:hypothetical protein
VRWNNHRQANHTGESVHCHGVCAQNSNYNHIDEGMNVVLFLFLIGTADSSCNDRVLVVKTIHLQRIASLPDTR